MLSAFQLLAIPAGMMVLAGMFLAGFGNILTAVSTLASKSAVKATYLESAQPAFAVLKNFMDNLFGSASNYKVTLNHVLLMVIVFMLMALYNVGSAMVDIQRERLMLDREVAEEERKRAKQD